MFQVLPIARANGGGRNKWYMRRLLSKTMGSAKTVQIGYYSDCGKNWFNN